MISFRFKLPCCIGNFFDVFNRFEFGFVKVGATPPPPGTKPKFTLRDVIKIVYAHPINLCQSCLQGTLLVFEKWKKDRPPPTELEKGINPAMLSKGEVAAKAGGGFN